MFFDAMRQNEDCSELLKRALYVCEDNIKPGLNEYNEERFILTELVAKNKEYVDSLKNDELATIRELEQLEKEIRERLGGLE